MSYSLANMLTKVRELLNESTAAFWTDTEIQGWIQDGTIDVASKLLCFVSYSTITLVDSQYRYTPVDESWIGDCIKPKQVLYLNASGVATGMQSIDLKQFGHDPIVDQPPRYYYFNSTSRAFFISPTPDSTTAGHTLAVLYSSDTDTVTDILDEYQSLVILYACYKAKLKERLYQEAMMYYQLYKDSLLFERQDKYDPTKDINDDLLIK